MTLTDLVRQAEGDNEFYLSGKRTESYLAEALKQLPDELGLQVRRLQPKYSNQVLLYVLACSAFYPGREAEAAKIALRSLASGGLVPAGSYFFRAQRRAYEKRVASGTRHNPEYLADAFDNLGHVRRPAIA